MRRRPRVALLFPDFGLIDGELCDLAEKRGAEAVIFRVSAEGGPSDQAEFVGRPELLAGAVSSMGSLENLARVAGSTRLVDPDAVAWVCTSGSFLGPEEVVGEQCAVLTEASGAPSTTTSVAILHALRSHAAQRVVSLTPYPKLLGRAFSDYLERHGLEVLGEAHAGGANDEEISAMTADDFAPLAQEAWRDGAEALVLPCTALRVGQIETRLEGEYGVPIVMANPATIAHAVELAASVQPNA